MSKRVDVADVPEQLRSRGLEGWLVTVADGGRPHPTHVVLTLTEAGAIRVPVGRASSANVVANPTVTIIVPGTDDEGLSLLVDGQAALEGDEPSADGWAVITPTGAVRHRPARADDQAACGPAS